MVPNARSPITGFAALLATSSTGAKVRSISIAASSRAIAVATERTGGDAVARDDRCRREMGERRRHAVDAPALVIDRDERGHVGVERVQVPDERAHGLGISGICTEERDTGEGDVGMEPPRLGVERRAGETAEEQSRDDAPE